MGSDINLERYGPMIAGDGSCAEVLCLTSQTCRTWTNPSCHRNNEGTQEDVGSLPTEVRRVTRAAYLFSRQASRVLPLTPNIAESS